MIPQDSPKRYKVSKLTLMIDRLMGRLITTGGIAIIIAVCGIMVFLVLQILPLFRSAHLTALPETQIQTAGRSESIVAMAIDEWGVLSVLVHSDGTIACVPLAPLEQNQGQESRFQIPLKPGETLTKARFQAAHHQIIAGTNQGRALIAEVQFASDHSDAGNVIRASLGSVQEFLLAQNGLQDLDAILASDQGLIAGITVPEGNSPPKVLVMPVKQETVGLGERRPVAGVVHDLSSTIAGIATQILVDERGDGIVVLTQDSRVLYFFRENEVWQFRQSFSPFDDQPGRNVERIDWLLGSVSLVISADDGQARLFSLYQQTGFPIRRFGRTKDFPALAGKTEVYAASTRGKTFLRVNTALASLTHGTTTAERARFTSQAPVIDAVFSGKANRIVLRSADGRLMPWTCDDPHPEASISTFFGSIWYEGSDSPAYTWQSSASTDDVEPKISLIPLIVGTLKATFYALFFAVPIALMAALYTSEFMHRRLKSIIKPIIELMASLPSVVLGFLGALWLAQKIETRLPSLLLVALCVPAAALLMGFLWSRLSGGYRRFIPSGWEFLAAFLPLGLVVWGAWNFGPILEQWCFTVTDPTSGAVIHDFRRWWAESTGLRFDQRNAVVVGIMMGFAVIPIIFTIAEDAMSNVPKALRSGSLALGASRWQTAIRIVLPTASAGIFSAIMIGLGRAIGETMIVVMATGNTPIMGMNPFDGMRTLSANIAKEMPEAPVDSTLFRTLFLSALLLFAMTFIINTIAELARQHLREKYKTV